MRSRVARSIGALVLVVACAPSPATQGGPTATTERAGPAAPTSPTAAPVATPAVSAQAAFEAGDCALCHQVPGVDAAPRTTSCTGCHVWITQVSASPAKRAKAMEHFPLWERYERTVATYLEVPSLDAAMARLDPAWVRGYLGDPHDLRPHLPETMPRTALSGAQLDAIVGAFLAARAAVPTTPAPDPARVARGEALFSEKGCAACHTFGARQTTATFAMAPDLRHARARLSPDHAAAWIRDPRAVSLAATMPAVPLTEAEVLALRDYVLLADPGGGPAPPLPAIPAPSTSPVTWAMVEERVFGRICQHCHMNPELNQGRAGPGNAGGFGFAATGIDLQTREGVMAAADRIPASLERRRREAHRDHVGPGQRPAALTRPERPGMPLGLPPLSDDDTALVLGWIAQGMPE